ncbi:hypothetical protein ZIOFF_063623 [Zingiber officinale]|uniref:Uncharacterized protein n=1 Tax=Zingiber officinale TaxID=94328 RepID=A0A8J5K9U4_ZINOF|nr:hypothetical protein ZIOFF_063623 [Zingiber officinale]
MWRWLISASWMVLLFKQLCRRDGFCGGDCNDARRWCVRWTYLGSVIRCLTQMGSHVAKEIIFLDAAKKLKGGSVDLVAVNSFGSAFQKFSTAVSCLASTFSGSGVIVHLEGENDDRLRACGCEELYKADDVGFTRIVAASGEVHGHPTEADNGKVEDTIRVIEVAVIMAEVGNTVSTSQQVGWLREFQQQSGDLLVGPEVDLATTGENSNSQCCVSEPSPRARLLRALSAGALTAGRGGFPPSLMLKRRSRRLLCPIASVDPPFLPLFRPSRAAPSLPWCWRHRRPPRALAPITLQRLSSSARCRCCESHHRPTLCAGTRAPVPSPCPSEPDATPLPLPLHTLPQCRTDPFFCPSRASHWRELLPWILPSFGFRAVRIFFMVNMKANKDESRSGVIVHLEGENDDRLRACGCEELYKADDVGFTRIVAASGEVHGHPTEADNGKVEDTIRVIEVAVIMAEVGNTVSTSQQVGWLREFQQQSGDLLVAPEVDLATTGENSNSQATFSTISHQSSLSSNAENSRRYSLVLTMSTPNVLVGVKGWYITSHKLNCLNYLQWSQSVNMYICGKGKKDFLTSASVAPSPKDPKYKIWNAENQMVMSWLINSMDNEIRENFLRQFAKDIWEATKETYSHSDNTSELFEVELNLHDLRQGELLTQYFNSTSHHWQQVNILDVHQWACKTNVKLHRKIKEQGTFKFLFRLNSSLDNVCLRSLSLKQLPSMREAFAEMLRDLPSSERHEKVENQVGFFFQQKPIENQAQYEISTHSGLKKPTAVSAHLEPTGYLTHNEDKSAIYYDSNSVSDIYSGTQNRQGILASNLGTFLSSNGIIHISSCVDTLNKMELSNAETDIFLSSSRLDGFHWTVNVEL